MDLTWTLACGESRKEDVNVGGTQPARGEQKQMAVKDNRGEIRTQGGSSHKRVETLRNWEAPPSTSYSSVLHYPKIPGSGPRSVHPHLAEHGAELPSASEPPQHPRLAPHGPPGTAPKYYNMGRNLEGFGRRPNRAVTRKARFQGSMGPGKRGQNRG